MPSTGRRPRAGVWSAASGRREGRATRERFGAGEAGTPSPTAPPPPNQCQRSPAVYFCQGSFSDRHSGLSVLNFDSTQAHWASVLVRPDHLFVGFTTAILP